MASDKATKFLSEPLLWVAMSMVGVVLMGPSAANLARGLVGGDPTRGDVDEHGEPLGQNRSAGQTIATSNSSIGDRMRLAQNAAVPASSVPSNTLAATMQPAKPATPSNADAERMQTLTPVTSEQALVGNQNNDATDASSVPDADEDQLAPPKAGDQLSAEIRKRLAETQAANARSEASGVAKGKSTKHEDAFDINSMINEVEREFDRPEQAKQNEPAKPQVADAEMASQQRDQPATSGGRDGSNSATSADSSATSSSPEADLSADAVNASNHRNHSSDSSDSSSADEDFTLWQNPEEFESGLQMLDDEPGTDQVTHPAQGTGLGSAPAISQTFDSPADTMMVPPESGDNWWNATVGQQFWPERHPQLASLDSVVFVALQNSAQVQILNDEPQIQSTFIQEREADFDWSAFVDASWRQTNEPVRNELQTGLRTGRFEEDELIVSSGLKKQLAQGGELAIGSSIGTLDNNSVFLSPPDQGLATFSLDYRQPLMRGRGREIAESQIVLARLSSEATAHASKQKLQQHLADVVTAYWSLYRARGILSQRNRNAARAQAIAEQLSNHADRATLARQINRARAIASTRRSDVIDAEYNVADAQERLMNLTHGDNLADAGTLEIVPTDAPPQFTVPHDLSAVTQMAISNRPEVKEVLTQIKAATVHQAIALDSLKPQLDAILSSYVLGVNGFKNVGDAIGNQFTNGDPSYSVGMAFEVPIGRRAGNARVYRQEIQRRLLQNRLRKTLGDVTLNARAAFRDVYRLNAIVDNNRQVVQQSVTDLNEMQKQMKLLTSKDQSANLYLNDLLLSQDRLSNAEQSLLDSQAQLAIAYVNLKRATGELLRDNAGDCVSCGETIQQATYEQPVEHHPHEYQPPETADPSIPLDHGTAPRAVQPVPASSETAHANRPRPPRRASSAALSIR